MEEKSAAPAGARGNIEGALTAEPKTNKKKHPSLAPNHQGR